MRSNHHFEYVLVPFGFLSVWALVSGLELISPFFLPSPRAVLTALIALFVKDRIIADIGFTLYRMGFGFTIACLIGVPLGLLMGYSNRIYASSEFMVELFRSIPATALLPLFILFLGIGDASKIAVAAWSPGLILAVHSMYGVHSGKEMRLKAGKSMRMSMSLLFRKIILPEALPHIFSGMRIALSLSLVLVVVSEMMIGSNTGIGQRLINSQLHFNTPDLYAVILVIGFIGYCLNKILQMFEKRFIHWKKK